MSAGVFSKSNFGQVQKLYSGREDSLAEIMTLNYAHARIHSIQLLFITHSQWEMLLGRTSGIGLHMEERHLCKVTELFTEECAPGKSLFW